MAVSHLALRERAGEVAAPIGEYMDFVLGVPDDQDGNIACHAACGLAGSEPVGRPDQARNGFAPTASR